MIKISAIVRAHNEARTIKRSILSIIEQPVIDEIVFVDNLSDDGTSKLVDELIKSHELGYKIKKYEYPWRPIKACTEEAKTIELSDPRARIGLIQFAVKQATNDWVWIHDGDCVTVGADIFIPDNVKDSDLFCITVDEVISADDLVRSTTQEPKIYNHSFWYYTREETHGTHQLTSSSIKHNTPEYDACRQFLPRQHTLMYHFGWLHHDRHQRQERIRPNQKIEKFSKGQVNPFGDLFNILTFLVLVKGERFETYADRLIGSITHFHPEAELAIMVEKPSESFLGKYPEINVYDFRGDNPTVDKFILADTMVRSGEIAYGSLVIIDADVVLLDRVDEFFYFERDMHNAMHIAHDTAPLTMRNIDDEWKRGKVGGSYLHECYTDMFHKWDSYADKVPFNAGVIVFNVEHEDTEDLLAGLTMASHKLGSYEQVWPREQGLLSHAIYHSDIPYKVFGFEYNSSAGEHIGNSAPSDTIKIMHYHDDQRFNEELYNKKMNNKKNIAVDRRRPTLHLLGLAHTITKPEFSHCAYTMKVYKMEKMMKALGYEVIHYGAEGAEVENHVDIVSRDTWEADYGSHDIEKYQFKFSMEDKSWQEFINRGRDELHKRVDTRAGDLVLSSFGYPHHFALDVTPAVIEMGIGYGATFANFRVFESYAWMNECRAREDTGNPNAYHVVIPNYFDRDEFKFSLSTDPSNQYLAFLGRMNRDKGVEIAAMIADKLEIPLYACGQRGMPGDNYVDELTEQYPMFRYMGSVGIKERSKLLSGASATFVPSQYPEPFGGVAVESMMCGTPVITSDWGAFPETVVNGRTGYRCRTLRDYVEAGQKVLNGRIDRMETYNWAVNTYSLTAVGKRYDRYFNDVQRVLLGAGWSDLSKDWY
jgi:glycosyltransferase involved in cell wall biosynthesis